MGSAPTPNCYEPRDAPVESLLGIGSPGVSAEPFFEDDTQEDFERGRRPARASLQPFLFVVFEADRPLAGGARLCLDQLDEISFVRGERGASQSRSGHRSLCLGLPGRAVSAMHARLFRKNEGWLLEDTGSTNGTYVNGVRCARALLGPADIFELGRTFMVLRHHEAGDAQTPPFFDAAMLAGERPGLATLLPKAARRLAALRRAAASSIPVLLSGETGTGKEVVSRAVHELSGRSGPLVAINCATLTDHLGPAQFSGHVRGAFSGAVADAPGLVRSAHEGTLLLDEIQELLPANQAALLRILQEHEVVPVGGVRPIKVDVRVIATSPSPLDEAARSGAFRPDLFARLSGFSHALEPLRHRIEDLGLLIAALLATRGVTAADRPRIAPELGEQLLRHAWPLNVRELDQLLRRAWLFARDGLMESGDLLAEDGANHRPPNQTSETLAPADRALRERLSAELDKAGGNVALVARTMGKAPVQIRRWAKRLGLDVVHFRQIESSGDKDPA
jgi:DNA-binding NtrC family response regulator